MSKKSPIPLRAETSRRYIKRLGRDVGLEQPLLQLYIQRATGNTIDSTLFLISLILLIL